MYFIKYTQPEQQQQQTNETVTQNCKYEKGTLFRHLLN